MVCRQPLTLPHVLKGKGSHLGPAWTLLQKGRLRMGNSLGGERGGRLGILRPENNHPNLYQRNRLFRITGISIFNQRCAPLGGFPHTTLHQIASVGAPNAYLRPIGPFSHLPKGLLPFKLGPAQIIIEIGQAVPVRASIQGLSWLLLRVASGAPVSVASERRPTGIT